MSFEKRLKVLVVGSGGREHAIVHACRQSRSCGEIIVAPGNGGIQQEVPCFPTPVDDISGLVQLALSEEVDFVVVGPEVPLSLGLVDALEEAGILAYGPRQSAARLEASKIFTKDLLEKYAIPTARAQSFSRASDAIKALATFSFPVVIKADGLAAGKGVVIAATKQEAEETIFASLDKGVFGDSGRRILIEEHLRGEEASIHLMVSGETFLQLPTSQDHKRLGDADTGPNTGGMGAYSPAPLAEGTVSEEILLKIVKPCVQAIAKEGLDFRGTLYIGLMFTGEGPKVLEFNVRFGDPETQVIVPRIENDFLDLMRACAAGELAGHELKVRPEQAICVVLAAGGYPGQYRKGDRIELPRDLPPNTFIFHAGTKAGANGTILTNGGRVLGVTALDSDLSSAAETAYAVSDRIKFANMHFRRDIGRRSLSPDPKPSP
ncbi:MAG: phosphoribosylamine--glycine ligase [Opitutales bacterium]